MKVSNLYIGTLSGTSADSIDAALFDFGKKISGSFGGECKPEKDIPRYLKLLFSSKIDFDGLVTERYELSDINYAISRIKNGKSIGRVLIDL